MMDFENVKYLMATKPEAAFATLGLTAIVIAGVVAPLAYVLAPVAKMVITIGVSGA